MKFRNIKVKKSGGGYRMQRAMVLANGQLKFVKNKHGGAHAPRKAAKHVAKKHRRSPSKALVRKSSRTHRVSRKPHRRGRRGGGGGGINIMHLALAGAALGYAGSSAAPDFVKTTVAKVPGNKTFGAAATIGLLGLGVDKFIKPKGLPGKIARYAGYGGILLAAIQLGAKNKDFQWVGDTDDVGDYDLGDEDVGDEDVGDEDISDVGDDE